MSLLSTSLFDLPVLSNVAADSDVALDMCAGLPTQPVPHSPAPVMWDDDDDEDEDEDDDLFGDEEDDLEVDDDEEELLDDEEEELEGDDDEEEQAEPEEGP